MKKISLCQLVPTSLGILLSAASNSVPGSVSEVIFLKGIVFGQREDRLTIVRPSANSERSSEQQSVFVSLHKPHLFWLLYRVCLLSEFSDLPEYRIVDSLIRLISSYKLFYSWNKYCTEFATSLISDYSTALTELLLVVEVTDASSILSKVCPIRISFKRLK